jgi:glycine/D-amino acid oxidase-like deaminating enzyme
LHDRLPTVKDIAVRACWSGYVSAANDALPVIGVTGAHGNIHYTAGCSGHGLAPQSLAGHMIAERILGKDNPLFAAFERKVIPVLPEPLQWCVTKAALGVAGMLDRRVNRRVLRG